jgi:hypothetical protein
MNDDFFRSLLSSQDYKSRSVLDQIQNSRSTTACSNGFDLTPMHPFGEPHVRESGEERRMRGRGEESSSKKSLNPHVSNSPPWGAYI